MSVGRPKQPKLYTDSPVLEEKERYPDRVQGALGDVFAFLTKPKTRGQLSEIERENVG